MPSLARQVVAGRKRILTKSDVLMILDLSTKRLVIIRERTAWNSSHSDIRIRGARRTPANRRRDPTFESGKRRSVTNPFVS